MPAQLFTTFTGARGVLIASITFPVGFEISFFTEDTDPIAIDESVIGVSAATTGGGMVTHRQHNIITLKIGVKPGSPEARNLEILYDANRPALGRPAVEDTITLAVTTPDGVTYTYQDGAITSGTAGVSGKSDGSKATHVYTFAFNSRVRN